MAEASFGHFDEFGIRHIGSCGDKRKLSFQNGVFDLFRLSGDIEPVYFGVHGSRIFRFFFGEVGIN